MLLQNFATTWFNKHLTKTRLLQSLELIHAYVAPYTLGKINAQIGFFCKYSIRAMQNSTKKCANVEKYAIFSSIG